MRTPYTQNFNLNLQQQLGSRAVLQIGYVGAKGTKLFRFRDINQPSQAQITASTRPAVCWIYRSQLSDWRLYGPDGINFNVPRTVFPNFFYINQAESTANSDLSRAANQPAREQLAWA